MWSPTSKCSSVDITFKNGQKKWMLIEERIMVTFGREWTRWVSEWLLNVVFVYVGSKYTGTLTCELCVCWLQYIVYIKLFCNVKEAPWFKRGFVAALFSSTQFFQKINHTYIHPPKRKVCLLHAMLCLQASESSFMLGKLSGFGDPFGGYGNGLWLRWLLFFWCGF